MSIAEAKSECAHCGLPAGRWRDPQGNAFCCSGCQSVYTLLHECGWQDYYRLREEFAGDARPVEVDERAFEEFDQVTEADGHAVVNNDIFVPDIHCGACVWLLEKAIATVPGVQRVTVDATRKTVSVARAADASKLSRVAAAIARLGYHPVVNRSDAIDRARVQESRRQLLRLGVTGALAGNIMLLSVPLYAGGWYGIAPEFVRLFQWLALALAIPVATYGAWPFHARAWKSLRHGILHIDLPISLGVGIAFIGSAYATVARHTDVYFDSLSGLVFFLLVGRQVLSVGQRRAERAAEQLAVNGTPYARIVDPERGDICEVAAEAVRIGDICRIETNQSSPVDGTIVRGDSYINASVLTGESLPRRIACGERFEAGCINLGPAIDVKAEQVGADTRLAELARLLRDAADERPAVVETADRVAVWFTVATLVASASTFAVWWSAGIATAVSAAVSVAVVMCPCALGLATPLALAVAQGRAGKAGIMVKGAGGIQRLSEVESLVFDKTGTITAGQPEIVEWRGLITHNDIDLRDVAASLQAYSLHPLASAFRRYGTALYEADRVRESTGRGIQGRVAGMDVRIGAPEWVGNQIPPTLSRQTGDQRVVSATYIALDGQVVASVWTADPVYNQAASHIETLQKMGIDCALLSGDQQLVVDAVAADVGIASAAGLVTPEGKLFYLRHTGKRTGMVGDGANDAAAMAAAHAGISVAGGVQAAIAAADAYLLKPGISDVVQAIRLSRRAMKTIHRNIVLSIVYNSVGLVLASTGHIGPLGAALLMPISSVTVMLSSMVQGKTQ